MKTHTSGSSNSRSARTARAASPVVATAIAAVAAALFVTSGAPRVYAQEAAPPPNAAGPAAQPAGAQDADPPGRVARLNYMAGTVTTEPAGATDWSYAQVNRPLTTGDQLWNDKGARSELHIGSTAVRVGESTNVDILNLDDDSTQLKVAQGTLSTRVRELPAGTSYEIDTPNLALGIDGPGDYRVDVAPDGSETTVTVRGGNATVYGDSGQLPIAAGQQIRFSGTNLQQIASNGAPAPDALDQWAASRDAAEDNSVSARYVSRDVPGYQDLDANGTWSQNPQYGAVWTPNQMPAGWAPYQDGHWVWQAPWGWTWVDDAPWGFAPYHYGRWAYIGNSWAWVPGEIVSEPPVYAPALVAFVGDGGGGGVDWGVSLAVGGVATAGLAWFALGPGEPWHPHWGHGWSPRYYDRVNRPIYVHNRITNIHNTYINYRVPHAITCVPATAFVHGQPVNRFAQKVDPRQWHNARFNAGAPGIAPVRQSFGPGMRNAAFRPPAAAAGRPVVATRRPDVPPAYRDHLAQQFAHGGGRVAGAGNPVVHTSVPASFRGSRIGAAGGPQPNVRLVAVRGPGSVQGRQAGGAPRPGVPPQAGFAPPGTRGEPNGRPPGGQPNGVPHPQPFAGGAPGQARAPMPAQAGAGAPQQANVQARPGNGVPRPPQSAGGMPNPGTHAGPQQLGNVPQAQRREPSWTQPHTPIGQQRGGRPDQPFAQGAGRPPQMQAQPQAQQTHGGQLRPEFNPQANTPRPPAQGQPRVQQPGGRAPQAQQPMQQARPEFHPQPMQQPRPEFHPPQVQQPRPQPMPQPRPQQVQQPRPAFHPQPQPVQQPRPQPVQQPRPQPHQEQRATGGGRDDHRHG
ncbi:DUF6600 domain-containing protein [Paraburkholderia sp. SOS3]|jgi:hypothetical protein|uniref:DUF6600 domain-containing protein n=1 Tax=Paraburkholderia sp. SOS3 TaxID=1926494 RepID=UPI0009474DDA|nr:DUF6600 domain-containing protein [Paraburkholderia sp. SOS3]APR36577.1 FecR protein [Paraburkholderia sp. SOS3]